MLLDSNKFEVSKEKHPVWAKLPALAEALDTYPDKEWVWWLDIDAIIMTPDLDLYSYLLNPIALQDRLLKGEKIISNKRIRIDGRLPPELWTGEVSELSSQAN